MMANHRGLLVAVLGPILVTSSAATAAQTTLPLQFSGPQEVPGPGDPDGTASGTLTFDTIAGTLSWSFTYANIAAPTLMHIHPGAAGVGGGVLVDMGVATSGGAGTLISSVPLNVSTINDILGSPTGFYVNIHNGPFPNGAVRAQIPQMFGMDMNGAREVPGPGDADGCAVGPIVFDTGMNRISWSFSYVSIDTPTLMHIHTGAVGVGGGVLVDLGVATSGGPGTLIASTTTSAVNMTSILNNPQNFYVNIHTGPFPNGAVRGQLIRTSCIGDLNGDGKVGSGDVALMLGSWGFCP